MCATHAHTHTHTHTRTRTRVRSSYEYTNNCTSTRSVNIESVTPSLRSPAIVDEYSPFFFFHTYISVSRHAVFTFRPVSRNVGHRAGAARRNLRATLGGVLRANDPLPNNTRAGSTLWKLRLDPILQQSSRILVESSRRTQKMWGRASISKSILLLAGWACILFPRCEGIGPEPGAVEIESEAILERATTWLWNQRDKDAGWGNDTHRVLLALRLANLSRDENLPSPTAIEMQLSGKQMELEIVLLLWRHHEVGFAAVHLARYTLALNALCMDPRQFHGHDLIGTLQHHQPTTDYEFALTTLAACSAQAHVRKRQIGRLMDIAGAAQYHNVDTVAMVILALRCIVQDHRHRNLHHFVRKPSLDLAHQQRLDGSFGDLHTTALAMQALEEVENEPADNWNKSAALGWLTSRQRPDGSFDGNVHATAEAVLGVAPRSLASIRTLDCGQGLTDSSPPRLTTSIDLTSPDNRGENLIPSTIGGNSSNASTESSIGPTTIPQMVNVSYTLWVGTNETHHLTVTAPKNETFYGVMMLAAEMSPHFQFSASEWPNGHYVHTLAGYKEEPMSYHYWLLYRLPSPPDLASPPGNQLVAPGGVDDLEISEGEHYLFWYKKL